MLFRLYQSSELFCTRNISCSNRTRPSLLESWEALYRTQLMRLSRALKEKRVHYYSRHDKIILLYDNARPHVAAPVKTYLETFKWEVLPRRILQTLLLLTTYSDRWRMACLNSTSHHMKISKIVSMIGQPQKMKRSSDAVSTCYQKDGKK